MPKIPVHTRKIAPSGEIPAVQMPYDVAYTGEEMIGKGLADIGAALTKIGQEQRRRENAMDLSKAIDSMNDWEFQDSQEFDNTTFTDSKQIDDWFSSHLSRRQQKSNEIMKGLNKEVAEQFTRQEVYTKDRDRIVFANATSKRKESFRKLEFETAIDNALKQGNEQRIPAIIMAYSNLYEAGEAEQIAKEKAVWFHAQRMTLENGTDYVQKSDLPIETQKQFVNNLKFIKEQEYKSLQDEFWSILQTGDYNALQTKVNLSPLPVMGEGGKNWWTNLIQRTQEEKIKTGISQIEEGDPIVLARTQAAVDLAADKITPQDLYSLADKGLGTKHIPSLVTRLKQNQKIENPIADKYRGELSRLLTAGLFGKKDKLDTSDTYLKLSRKLETFLTTNPTEEQLQKFFSTLIKDDVRWFFLGDNLPGWEEWPLKTKLVTPEGKKKAVSVNFGEIVEMDGEYYQAVGREEGKVIWLKVNPQ